MRTTPLLCLLSAFAVSSSQPVSTRMNIAVLDLESSQVGEGEATTLSNKLRGALVKTGQFTVVERGQMESILQEQGFQQTGCVSSECAIEVGQLLGVTHMVAGSIGRVGSIWVLSLRLINVESGGIERTNDFELNGGIEDMLLRGVTEAAAALAGVSPPPPTVVPAPAAPAQARPPGQQTLATAARAAQRRSERKKRWDERLLVLTPSYSFVFAGSVPQDWGVSLQVGGARRNHSMGAEISFAMKTYGEQSFMGPSGGINYYWYYEGLKLRDVLIVAPGLLVGANVYDAPDQTYYLFAGPKLKLEVGYRKAFVHADYTLHVGNRLVNQLDLGISFRL